MSEQCFITSIGAAQKYDEVTYTFQGRRCTTRFAPVATARLLDLRGRAVVVLTVEARRKWYEALAAELVEAGLQPEPVDIPDGRDADEMLAIFDLLQQRIPAAARIVLDVTFALRHLPFVYLATLTYLVGLRGVQVEGIYYGAHELPAPDGTRPIIEATPLFRLLQWYHALASARESGSWHAVASTLRRDVADLFRRGCPDQQFSRIQTRVDALGAALGSGLPLEAGMAARDLVSLLAEIEGAGAAAPAARLAVDALRHEAQEWAVAEEAQAKAGIALTEIELRRQLRLARWYADHADVPKALSLLREWVVNAAILVRRDSDRWLDFAACRKPTEQLLNALDYRCRAGLAPEAERQVASLWRRVADWRNEVQHAGLTDKKIHLSLERLRSLIGECEQDLPAFLPQIFERPRGARVLITPLGFSPGVVYSGLVHVQPSAMLVITSNEAAKRLPEALARAGRSDLRPLVRELRDPHAGFDEIAPREDPELRGLLADAAEVAVNVTGGTTAMQYAAEHLANEGHSLGVPVRRAMLIDRRPPEEQRAEPYVLGEIVWLDREDTEP